MLETTFSIKIAGSSADVCVQTKSARAFKVVLRDANGGRQSRVGEYALQVQYRHNNYEVKLCSNM